MLCVTAEPTSSSRGAPGWAEEIAFAFRRRDRLRAPFGKRVPDLAAPYDACDAPDDTGENAKRGLLPPARMDRV